MLALQIELDATGREIDRMGVSATSRYVLDMMNERHEKRSAAVAARSGKPKPISANGILASSAELKLRFETQYGAVNTK